MSIEGIILILAAAAMLIGAVVVYNRLTRQQQLVNNGWADIDVQLKRRADLIPQLVETVKGYAAHERALFEDIAEKRNLALAAGDNPARRGDAESALSRPVARLVAVAEDYPELKASGNFLDLQKELAETENKIEMARRFYNGATRELNTTTLSFPVNLVAAVMGFRARAYFEIEPADRAAAPVEFESRG